MKQLHKELKTELRFISDRMSKYANKKRLEGPRLKEGDPIYLIRKNIRTKRPSATLNNIKLGPFRIKEIKGPVTVVLELPKDMRIHPTFHISLLEPAPKNSRIITTQPLDKDMSNKEYKIEKILEAKLIGGQPHYLIKWLGYEDHENS